MDSARAAGRILGKSTQIETLRAQIERLAGFDAPGNPHVPTVLLQGETGTGKGLVARVMHDGGPRSKGPFIDVNCAAIPEAMLEAELFGFEAGAFTDARRAKPGLFEAATGGTLFLDEIDSLTPLTQSKVLKAIEEKQVRRLGSVESRGVDVKLIAATQKDLKVLADSGVFRADLYHRLAVLILVLPPLRERGEDAVVLAEHFLQSYTAAHGLTSKRFRDDARAWLTAYAWPGNVRELGHLMERVIFLRTADEIGGSDLDELCIQPTHAVAPASSPAVGTAREVASHDEAERIRAALGKTGGNVLRAARLLGLGRNALRYRMRKLGLSREDGTAESPRLAAPIAPVPSAAAAPPAAAADPTWEPKPVAVLVLTVSMPETAADARPDSEPWTVATRLERAIADKVEGFGGVFLQRSPSQLTAVFGVPRALEQMPQRPVQSALAIQRAAGSNGPEIRCAVHLGAVRIDTSAADPTARLLPIGDVFSLPERLLGHAGAGETVVSAQVARRVEGICQLQARTLQLGSREADCLIAYNVVGPLPAPAAAGATVEGAALTRFVGRERELDLLCDAFSRAAAGQGQVVFIAGEAGIGKSRLLAELRQRLAGKPFRWVEGRCASYGMGTPFLPVTDALRRYLEIEDSDDEASATGKITAELERLGPDVGWTLPFVKQALSLQVGDDTVRALDSASRRSELFRALRALMLRAAELEPIVLVVEDLHWIDPASEEYLSFVDEVIPTARVLLLLSHRSGYAQPFGDRTYHQRVTLSPLSGEHAAVMTRSILGTAEIPHELRSLIARKAEGNPFFVEELTKSLLEDGSLCQEDGRIVLARNLSDITVPDTIQDILIARIDRLAEESRRAIQVASVIGREFALRLLARISEAGEHIRTQVEELRGLELVYEKALHPELAYMFKHALTHDVAYESVIGDRRKALHRTIGLAIEELYADRLAEHYETLAHHFSRGEDWERALSYHERSAEKAAENHASRAVVEHCREALRIAEKLGAAVPKEGRRRLYEHLGHSCFHLSDYAASAEAYEKAAQYSSDGPTRALRLSTAAFSHHWAHRYDRAAQCNEAAIAEARDSCFPPAEGMALVVRGLGLGVRDADLDGFDRCLQQALAICAEHPSESLEGFIRMHTVLLAEWTGSYRDAMQFAERAIELGRRQRVPEMIIFPTWFLGKARCCLGDFGGAIAVLEEAHQTCVRIGDRAWRSRMLNTLGWCYAEIGSTAIAREHNDLAAALAREIGDPEILSNAAINLAANQLELGDQERAADYLAPIEEALSQPGDPWMRWRYRLHALDIRARLAFARREYDDALRLAEEQLAGARSHRAPKLEARALSLKGQGLMEADRREEAADVLRAAIEIAARIGFTRGTWIGYALLSECERRSGKNSAASEHARKVREIAERAAATLESSELRFRLIASALR